MQSIRIKEEQTKEAIKPKINLGSYVALGDSVTAGYADGALYFEGQQHSYVNILATLFQSIQPVKFKQPLLNPASVGVGFFGNSRMVLKSDIDCKGKESSALMYLAPRGDIKAFVSNTYMQDGPFNNLGVPGAKAINLLMPGYGNSDYGNGNFNPFFTRVASNPKTASVLSDALVLKPTFFSLFIGNNDILAYALSGGTTDSLTPLEGPPGKGFRESLNSIVNSFVEAGAQGVIATIPYITNIPYFVCIPYNGLWLEENEVDRVRSAFPSFSFQAGANPFVYEHPDFGICQAEKGDLILGDLLLDPEKCAMQSGKLVLPKKYVLTRLEVQKVLEHTVAFNTCIFNVAKDNELALADISAFLKTLRIDRKYNTALGSMEYNSNCIFSLDGVHLCSAGQFMLANVFMKSINDTYSR